LQQGDFGISIADAITRRAESRANVGSLAAAVQVIAAQIKLDRLLSGPDEIDLQQAEIQLKQAQFGRFGAGDLDRVTLLRHSMTPTAT
jgi:hypothetical protein